MPTYDATALDGELKAAGLSVAGCKSDGTIWWVGVPSAGNLTTAAGVLAAHNPTARATAEENAANQYKALKQSALFDDTAWNAMTAAQQRDFIRLVQQKTVKRLLGESS
jgi:hypothetical protein